MWNQDKYSFVELKMNGLRLLHILRSSSRYFCEQVVDDLEGKSELLGEQGLVQA